MAAVAVFAKVIGLLSDKFQLATANYMSLSTWDAAKTGIFSANGLAGVALLKGIDKGGAALGMLLMGFGKDALGNEKGFLISACLSVLGYILALLTGQWGYYIFLTGKTLIGIGIGFEYVLAPSALSEGASKAASSRYIGYLYTMSSVAGSGLVDLLVFIGLSMDPDSVDDGNPTEKRNGIIVLLYAIGLTMVIAGLAARCTLKSHGSKSKNIFPVAPYYKVILSTSLAWFMYDYCEYGLDSNKSNLLSFTSDYYRFNKVLPSLLVSLIYIFPLLAVSFLTGRTSLRNLQAVGFAGCGTFCTIMGVVQVASNDPKATVPGFLGFLLFFLQKSFQAFLGITTMALATECYPLDFRGKALGVSAAIGKVGAFTGTMVISAFSNSDDGHVPNYVAVWFSCVAVCVLGLIITFTLTPHYTVDMRTEMLAKCDAGEYKEAVDILYGKVPVQSDEKPLVT